MKRNRKKDLLNAPAFATAALALIGAVVMQYVQHGGIALFVAGL